MVVEELMTTNPVTIEVTAPISKAINTLLELDVRHLPVTDRGKLVGMVTDRDLRAFHAPSLLELEKASEVTARLRAPVSRVMSTDVITVGAEADISEVIDLMIEHRVGAIPVVSEEDDRLLGIVSYVDVLRAAREDFEEE